MRPDLDLVADLTRSVLPSGLGVAACDPRCMPDTTDPTEAAAVRNAVPRRKAEFHAGRAAARAAMGALGLPPRPVPAAPDRAPIWPDGMTGSISHCATACVAVLGRSADWAAIGIDLENSLPLDASLVPEICTASERRWLQGLPEPERGLMAKLIFSAKEAAYKAQYPISGALFGFDGLNVTIDRAQCRFSAQFEMSQGPFPKAAILAGSYAHAAGVLVTGVTVGQSEAKRITG